MFAENEVNRQQPRTGSRALAMVIHRAPQRPESRVKNRLKTPPLGGATRRWLTLRRRSSPRNRVEVESPPRLRERHESARA